MKVSEITFGTTAFVDQRSGTSSEQRIHDTIKAAIDAGVNIFDCAQFYDEGRFERLLGSMLAATNRPDSFVTVTHISAAGQAALGGTGALVASLERSCRHLQKPQLDVVMFDDPDIFCTRSGQLGELARDIETRGLSKWCGVSTKSNAIARAVLASNSDIKVLQMPFNLFSLANDAVSPVSLAARLEQRDIAFMAQSPLYSGMLTDEALFKTDYPHSDVRGRWPQQILERRRLIATHLHELALEGEPFSQAAIRMLLSFPFVSTVVVGMTKPWQVQQNCRVPLSEIGYTDGARKA